MVEKAKKKQGGPGKPFVPGDPRIHKPDPNAPRVHKQARPKTFENLRELSRTIGWELARDSRGKLILSPEGNPMTNIEMVLRRWLDSGNPVLQTRYMEIAFGKVPNDAIVVKHSVEVIDVTVQNVAENAAIAELSEINYIDAEESDESVEP